MSTFFDTFGWRFRKGDDKKKLKAGYVAPQNDDASFVLGEGYYGSYAYQLNFDQNVVDDFTLIHKYRSTAMHPEVDRAINEICNEVIDGTTDDLPLKLTLDQLDQPKSIKDKIEAEFKEILRLMNFNQDAYKIFRKWYVDGRMFYHVIIDPDHSEKGIKELRYVSPLHIKKIREERTELRDGIPMVVSYEDFFIYSRDLKSSTTPGSGGLKLTKDSVLYCNSGLVDESRNLVYSYLQKTIRSCNQLRMEEDAVVIYRLARAPERRVFYIDVDNMPRGKSEEYIKGVQGRIKNKIIYDAQNGEVKDSYNMLSMMEDYWMPRRNGKNTTEVTTLQGGQNLGEIQDIEYFRRKLFESMGVPVGRLMSDQSGGFGLGRSGEITREEVTFGAFIERLRKDFGYFFKQALKTQLMLKKVIAEEDWDDIEPYLKLNFASNTYFAELKEMELLKERVATVQMLDPNTPIAGTYLSKLWIKKNIFHQNDEDIEDLQKEMDEENEQLKKELESGESPAQLNLGIGPGEMFPTGGQGMGGYGGANQMGGYGSYTQGFDSGMSSEPKPKKPAKPKEPNK